MSAVFAWLLLGCADEPHEASAPARPDCHEGQKISSVSGSIRAQGSSVMGNESAQLCLRLAGGTSLCLQPQQAGDSGDFSITVPEEFGCIEHGAVRLWSPEPRLASIYCPLETHAPAPSLGSVWLPWVPAASLLPPEADEHMPRTLMFDDGLSLTVAPSALRLDRGSYETMGARRVLDAEPRPCFVPTSTRLDGLYAFSVEGDIEGQASVSIPNVTGLPAGARVALYVLGTQWCTRPDGQRIEEGELQRFGEARVSLDGTRIEGGDADGGLPCLGWLGYGLDDGP